jgi:hypothetical protein
MTLVALNASASSCNVYFSDLQIVNGTDSRVSNLTVSAAGKTWKLRDLEPRERVAFYQHLSGEGAPPITWKWHAKRFSGSGCYYTGTMPANGTVTIDGERLVYRCG